MVTPQEVARARELVELLERMELFVGRVSDDFDRITEYAEEALDVIEQQNEALTRQLALLRAIRQSTPASPTDAHEVRYERDGDDEDQSGWTIPAYMMPPSTAVAQQAAADRALQALLTWAGERRHRIRPAQSLGRRNAWPPEPEGGWGAGWGSAPRSDMTEGRYLAIPREHVWDILMNHLRSFGAAKSDKRAASKIISGWRSSGLVRARSEWARPVQLAGKRYFALCIFDNVVAAMDPTLVYKEADLHP